MLDTGLQRQGSVFKGFDSSIAERLKWNVVKSYQSDEQRANGSTKKGVTKNLEEVMNAQEKEDIWGGF